MYPKTLVTLGDPIRKRRLDLGLYQTNVAATLGADVQTVLNWEKNRQSPHLAVLPRIIEFLGYIPPAYSKVGDSLVETINHYTTHGWSREKFTELISVNETTVAKWEVGNTVRQKK